MDFLPRVIPVLLLHKGGLYKTLKFRDPIYVGDPINAIKVFNDKEVDELIFLDIDASSTNAEPNFSLISKLTSECFMPLCYGGGIKSLGQIQKLLRLGVEKVAINKMAVQEPDFIKQASQQFGSSTIVVSVDYKKDILGRNRVFIRNGRIKTRFNPVEFVKMMEEFGAGEILLNSIERDGMMNGYDIKILSDFSGSLGIPLIICGGAGKIKHFEEAVRFNASAVAAGSMFVFFGKHKAVLISYPSISDLKSIFNNEES
jgi:imidazole glycerol-phosphate synthase subunit HisF